MSKPDYQRWTGETEHLEDRMRWFVSAEAEARGEGCTFCRASVSPCGRQLVMEGWKVQPEHDPEPWFAFVGGEPVSEGEKVRR